MILQANPDSVRDWCLIPLRITRIRRTTRITPLLLRAADSLYERALTARLERLVGPPGTHPFPVAAHLAHDGRRSTSIPIGRDWLAQ
jgi:hypothetical protein